METDKLTGRHEKKPNSCQGATAGRSATDAGCRSCHPDYPLEGRDASSKGGLAAPGTVLWHEAKNESWDPAENIEAAITASPAPSAWACVWLVLSLLHTVPGRVLPCVTTRWVSEKSQSITTWLHVKMLSFMFSKKLCYCMSGVDLRLGRALRHVNLETLTGAPVQSQRVSLVIVAYKPGGNHQTASLMMLFAVCILLYDVSQLLC